MEVLSWFLVFWLGQGADLQIASREEAGGLLGEERRFLADGGADGSQPRKQHPLIQMIRLSPKANLLMSL